jgi:hypothetical protein
VTRKVTMLSLGLGALFGGLALSVWTVTGGVAFPAYATAVSAITTAAIIGNIGEHFSKRETKP